MELDTETVLNGTEQTLKCSAAIAHDTKNANTKYTCDTGRTRNKLC